MKRLPLVASFVLFVLLCASVAYWGLQLFKPPLRPVAAPPRAAQVDIRPEAAGVLFGGRAGKVATASNYQLKGVIWSGNPQNSVAILSADGKPALAVRAGTEFMPEIKVQEVHRNYILLAEGGAIKRVDLPENAPANLNVATTAPVPVQRTPTPPPPPPVVGIPTRAQTAAAGGSQPPITPQGAAATPQTAPAQAQGQAAGQGQNMAPPTVVVSPPPSMPTDPQSPSDGTSPGATDPGAPPVTSSSPTPPGAPVPGSPAAPVQ